MQPEAGEQGGQILVVLAGQDLRGSHQCRLPAVPGGEPDAGRGHHGLAAAHVALTQAVHDAAGGHVGDGLLHGAALGAGEGEGQGVVKGRKAQIFAGGAAACLPAGAQQLQAAGQHEKLLEHQTAAGDVQRLRRVGEVDVLIGIAGVAQVIGAAYLIRQYVRQQVAAGVQPLPHGLGQQGLADTGGQGIDGHDAARQQLPPLRLHHRIGHTAAQQVALHLTVEDIGLALVETGAAVILIEEGHIQRAAVVHGTHLHQRAAAGDAAGSGVTRQHGPHTGVFAHGQLPYGALQRPVLPAPGEVGQQILQCADAQLVQGIGAGLANALDIADVGVRMCHGVKTH